MAPLCSEDIRARHAVPLLKQLRKPKNEIAAQAKNQWLRRVLALAQAEAYATEWLLLFWLRRRDDRGFFLFQDGSGCGYAVAFFQTQQAHALR